MRQIAIIGLGFVADLYMAALITFPDIRLAAVCDRDPGRRARFPAYWGAKPNSSFESGETAVTEDVVGLIAAIRPGTVVLNLTNPHEHYGVTHALLNAGMHVYSEKPLATNMAHARELHALASEKGLLLASAPCSVLGEAAQLMWAAVREGVAGAPRLIYAELDDGFIPQAPTEAWLSESGAPWPREDEFRVGCTLEHAGYYLTWLIAMFGPIRTVVAASADLIPGKLPSGDASAPDFSVGTLFFESGVVARLTCSIIARHDHRLRIICDGGTLEMSAAWTNTAPVRFRPRLRIRRRLVEHPFPRRLKAAGPTHPKVPRRGAAAMNFALGPIEMLEALAEDRRCRLSADFALHLTEVTLALQNAGETSGAVRMTTRCPPMDPMPWAVIAGTGVAPSPKVAPAVSAPAVSARIRPGDPLAVGILGTGAMAGEMVRAIALCGRLRLVAVASASSEARAAAFAAKLDAPVRAYGTRDALLEDPEVRLVYIANATGRHAEDSIAALQAGKDVLVEKPVALDATGARAVVEAAAASGRYLAEAMWTLFLPAWQRLATVSQQGELGDPRHLTFSLGFPADRNAYARLFDGGPGGGVLLDRGVYGLALALKLLGPVEAVQAQILRGLGGADEEAAITLRHADGMTSQIAVSLNALLGNEAVLSCTRGSAAIDPPCLGGESVRVQRMHPLSPPAPGSGGKTAQIAAHLKSKAILRRLMGARGRLKREWHSRGAHSHLSMLTQVEQDISAGRQESMIASLALSVETMALLDRIRAAAGEE